MTKNQLGQFFTVKSDYILGGLDKYVRGKNVADPFAGDGDLLRWAKNSGARKVLGYDVDPRCADGKRVLQRDSLLNPGEYDFIVTNPPYLNVNKASADTKMRYFSNSPFEDLYQISLNSIMNSEEGIIIVPVNFLSAMNSHKIRKIFFERFKVDRINYFRHQVFPDTSYNVIALHYLKKEPSVNRFSIKVSAYPQRDEFDIELSEKHGWMIGGETLLKIYKQSNVLDIGRLTEDMVEKSVPRTERVRAAIGHTKRVRFLDISKEMRGVINRNIILLRAIDSGSERGKIGLDDIRERYDISFDCLISKNTSRHMIQLIFNHPISIREQRTLISLFNDEFNKLRRKYNSLLLTNYRDNDRKRVSFDFVYKYLNYLYYTQIKVCPEKEMIPSIR